MFGDFTTPAEWIRIAFSLFNTVLLLWLGLTVLLNAEKRGWGVWLAGIGLLLGGVFFVSHTILLVIGPTYNSTNTAWWFYVGMAPAIILPLAWYLAVLWYAGYWRNPAAPLRQRQQVGVTLVLAMMLGGIIFLVAKLFRTIPLFAVLDRVMDIVLFANIPIDAVGYVGYVLLCVVLSIDAVRQPAPSERVMGDLARQRARPWLVGASVTLLLVAVAVAMVVFWIIRNTRTGNLYVLDARALLIIGRYDLLILILIAAAILMLGQAISSYELFTGKTLPRQGLARYWRRAIILAAGYGAMISTSIAVGLIPIYTTLLTTFLMTLFFALIGWRAFAERQLLIENLRPFVRSQHLYEQLLSDEPQFAEVDAQQPLQALCADVLECERAHLIATGALAPLVPTLSHPAGISAETVQINPLIDQFTSPDLLCLPLEPAQFDQCEWSIPLWSERGLIGVLLLGPKRAGGYYTQEEIEVARTTGERLIDTQASVALAQRLMGMQRERMVQTQVIDQHSRRVLHDEVLPLLHTAMISLSEGAEKDEAVNLLGQAHKEVSDLLRELPMATTPDVARLGLIGALQRVVETEFAGSFDSVAWRIEAGIEQKLSGLGPVSAETLFFAARETIRNAAKYARHPERALDVVISAENSNQKLNLTIADNGVGLAPQQSKSGTGQGMALHSTLMAVVGGELVVDSEANAYTEVVLSVPNSQ